MTLTVLHLSDPHLTADPGSSERLRQVLDLPASRRPDAVVVTGDIADHGLPEEYDVFAAAMTGQPPWLAVPGNHDDPETLRKVLGQDECPVLDVGPVRVIGLDVIVPGEDHGFLRPETADLVVAAAAGAERVVLAFHQPPVPIGHAYADTMPLTNPDALVELTRRVPPVVAILCGHVHTAVASSLDGIPVLGAPRASRPRSRSTRTGAPAPSATSRPALPCTRSPRTDG
ncbi:metallophosphoesterase family protein [Kribbella sp. NPDC002412]